MMKLDTELKESGECVASEALADPGQARTVRFVDGAPVPTDGPFAEVKESLAGYWILDVDEDRALQIAWDAARLGRTEPPCPARRCVRPLDRRPVTSPGAGSGCRLYRRPGPRHRHGCYAV